MSARASLEGPATDTAPAAAARKRRQRLRWSAWTAGACLGVALISLLNTWASERATREALARLAAAPSATSDPTRPVLLPVVAPARLPRPGVMLGDFETEAELARWVPGDGVEAAIVPAPRRPGERAARIVFPARGLGGLDLYALPRDWRPFRALALDVYVAKAHPNLQLGARVDDQQSDAEPESRYETSVPLRPGWNAVQLRVDAIGRSIDLSAVKRIVLYLRSPRRDAPARSLIVDRVRLEP